MSDRSDRTQGTCIDDCHVVTLAEQDDFSSNNSEHASDHKSEQAREAVPNWIGNANLLWIRRRLLLRVATASGLLSLAAAFLIPKQYQSSTSIMPPMNSMSGAAMLASLAGRSGGGLGTLGAFADGVLGSSNNTALFVELLRSGTISSDLIERFDLQRVYRKRYRVDAARYLAHRTAIVDDKKSGVITITVTDTDPMRARDIAQGYLDELNLLVNRTNTSSARQERLFIETRLRGVKADLEQAQQKLSDFSSNHATVDLKEQTRALVDAASRIQSELITEQAALDSLRQTYGDGNIRVRSAQARISVLSAEIAKMSGSANAVHFTNGSGAAGADGVAKNDNEAPYPALRQMPQLAGPYADLYREIRLQETVYELLTQQYEMARIEEAKDVPVISVIDSPGVPEKKSFPPRLLLASLLTLVSVAVFAFLLLMQEHWSFVPEGDPRKALLDTIFASAQRRWLGIRGWMPRARSTS